MGEILRRTIPATTVGAYLVSVAEDAAPFLVGFHGYGQNAEACLSDLLRIPGSSALHVVAVEALHRFYDARHREVVGSWMTKVDREQAIADNVRYVASVVAEIAREKPGEEKRVYAGFSQGASMAYRAAAHGPGPARGIIALAGDLPADVADDPAVVLPPILIGRGRRDTWYTEEKLAADLDRLKARGSDVEVVRFDGGHEWTDEFRESAAAFLRRVMPPL
jgi:predicted esterase